jgi:ribosome-associated protein
VEDIDNEADEYSGPSKSQLKREMTALQVLGAELVELSRERLAKIEMPERLRDALLDAQRFTKHEAKRRQLQYIGKIMRDVDVAPLRAAMDEVKGKSEAANIRQHRLEKLRTRLMEDEAVFSELARDFPAADLQHLRQLRRNALKEAQLGKPPRAYRELFRELRELEGTEDAAEGVEGSVD